MQCCKLALRTWLQLFNTVYLALGGVIAGYGAYLIVKSPSPFSDLIVASGVFMFLLALLGCFSVGSRRGCLLSVYTLMMFVMVCVHIILAVFCIWKRSKLEDWVTQNTKDPEQAQKLKNFVETHVRILGYIILAVVVVEIITCLITCLARNMVLVSDDELEPWNEEQGRRLSENQTQPLLQSTPKTDTQRAQMNEKYGGIFTKHTATSTKNDVEIP